MYPLQNRPASKSATHGFASKSDTRHRKKHAQACFFLLYSPFGEFYCFAVVFGFSPSDIRYASLGGEYNITATIGSNITVACNNITLTRSAYHFQFDTAFVSTNAVLVRKRRQTFGTNESKAPSGRELPTKSGEGECVAIICLLISK